MNKLLVVIALVIGFSMFTLMDADKASAMNKGELVDAIAADSGRGNPDAGLSKADAKRALDGFVTATSDALKKGEKISLVGFGSFSISKRAARTLSGQGDLTPQEQACLWLAGNAPEWLHGIFCTTTETELIALMIESSGPKDPLDIKDVQMFLNSFKAVTTNQLVQRDVVDVGDFGTLYVKENKGRKLNTVEFDASSSFLKRTGRNPQTGKEIQIAAKNVVKFKAGADLSKKVN